MVREQDTATKYPVSHAIYAVASAIGGLLAIAFCVFVTASCGGGGGLAPDGMLTEAASGSAPGEDTPSATAVADGLAAISGPHSIKTSSFYQEDMERLGNQFSDAFNAPRRNVSADGAFARFDGEWLDVNREAEGLAYCLYDFDMTGYDGSNEFTFDWMQGSDEGTAYIGFSDWASNTFVWKLIPADGVVHADLSKFIDPATGRMYAMVVVMGDNPWVLGKVTVGEPSGNLQPASGYVKELDGSPVRNAKVHLTGDRDRWATTDYAGRYEFTYLPQGDYTVTPEAFGRDFTPSEFGFSINDWKVVVDDFFADPESYINVGGRILSDDGETPMAGVPVLVESVETPGFSDDITTDLNGDWWIQLPAGDYEFQPQLAGWDFTPRLYQEHVEGFGMQELDFSGSPAAVVPVSGHVKDEAAVGVSGVEIFFSGAVDYSTFTDSFGNFQLPAVFSGTYEVQAYQKGKSFAPANVLCVVEDQPVLISDFTCSDVTKATAYGYCTKPDGVTPEPGVSIDLMGGGNYYRATTDENGYWEITNIDEGQCVVEPYKEDHLCTPDKRIMHISGTTRVGNIICAPQREQRVFGNVCLPNRNGVGLEGVSVNIDNALRGMHADTDADGNWERLDVPEGSYTVRPFKNGYGFDPAERQIIITDSEVNVASFTAFETQTSDLDGHVYELDGVTPIVGARVSLSGESFRAAFTDVDGHWVINSVVEGDYTMKTKLSGWNFNPLSQQITVAGAAMTLDDITGWQLELHKLQGYVLDDDGVTPLSGIELTIHGATTYLATSDEVGHWSTMVYAGTYMVEPSTIGFSYSPVVQSLTVADNLQADDFLATPIAQHTISGKVFEPDGVTPMAGVTVRASGDSSFSTQTDAQGAWSLELHEGVYRVYASIQDFYFTPMQTIVFNYEDQVLDDFIAHEYE